MRCLTDIDSIIIPCKLIHLLWLVAVEDPNDLLCCVSSHFSARTWLGPCAEAPGMALGSSVAVPLQREAVYQCMNTVALWNSFLTGYSFLSRFAYGLSIFQTWRGKATLTPHQAVRLCGMKKLQKFQTSFQNLQVRKASEVAVQKSSLLMEDCHSHACLCGIVVGVLD